FVIALTIQLPSLSQKRSSQFTCYQFFLLGQQLRPLRFTARFHQSIRQIFRRRSVPPHLPLPVLFNEFKEAHEPLLTLLPALEVDGCEGDRRPQTGLLAFYLDPRDRWTAKTFVLACKFLLQALLIGPEVW